MSHVGGACVETPSARHTNYRNVCPRGAGVEVDSALSRQLIALSLERCAYNGLTIESFRQSFTLSNEKKDF